MILRSKTRNPRQLNQLHHVFIANGQLMLQKNVGLIPMPLIDPNGSNRTIQKTTGMMFNNKLDPSRPFMDSQKPFELKKPRLQWAEYTSVRQYVLSDPPTIVYHSHQIVNTGLPSVVRQEQMEKGYISKS